MDNYHGRLLLNRMQPLLHTQDMVQREGLHSTLWQHKRARLIVLHAPAGYGKTTLLAQYYGYLRQKSQTCCWLSLDAADDDPVQFLAYLIASIGKNSEISKDVLDAAYDGFHGLEEKEAFNLTVNTLSRLPEPTYLLLDDLNFLSGTKTQALLQRLVELTLANSHFIVTSREAPLTLKSRLQLQGGYYELTTADLSFNTTETQYLLSQSIAEESAQNLTTILQEKTEGWAAAIEFSKNWLKRTDSDEIDNIINHASDFTTFLTIEILSQLPSHILTAMRKSSIVNELSGDLINTLCHVNNGWQILDELYKRDLVIAVDEAHSKYRYHHLLSQFLLDQLNREAPEQTRSLNRLAAQWYLKKDDAANALRHAIACQEPQILGPIIEQSGGWRLVLDGRISTLTSALEQLPKEVIKKYPRTYLGAIMLYAKKGRITEAIKQYNAYRETTQNFTQLNNQALDKKFTKEAKAIDFFLGGLEDRPQTAAYIAKMEAALKDVGRSDHLLQANLLNYVSYGYFDSGEYNKAYTAGEKAMFHYRELNSIYGENYLYFHLGKICLTQGRLRDADQFYEEGYQLALDNYGKDSDMVAIASAFLAEAAFEKNDLTQAQQYLQCALPHINKSEAWFDVYTSAYLTEASIYDAQGDAKSAQKILLNASKVGRRRNMQRLRLIAASRSIHLLVANGEMSKANWIISKLQLNVETIENKLFNYRLRQEIETTVTYYLIKNGQYDAAIGKVEPLIVNAKSSQNRHQLISLSILSSLAYFKKGKDKQAISRLNIAISDAIFEKLTRPFIEYGEDLHPLLELILSDQRLYPINRLKRSFISDIIRNIKKENKTRKFKGSGFFTAKEQEIAEHISSGCSNKEIARLCECSENTVKYHAKNIFKKLGVNNRKQVAQMLLHNNHEL